MSLTLIALRTLAKQAILDVQSTIGDRSDVIRKQYVAYKLYDVAKNDLGLATKPILERFSLLTVMYGSAGIREHIGLNPYGDIDFMKRLVPTNKVAEFKQVMTWIFGNTEEGFPSVINDSRKITKELNAIVQHEEAREYLDKYRDLEGAFERTSGERDYLAKTIKRATRSLETSLKFAYKYKKDEELLELVDELEKVLKSTAGKLSEVAMLVPYKLGKEVEWIELNMLCTGQPLSKASLITTSGQNEEDVDDWLAELEFRIQAMGPAIAPYRITNGRVVSTKTWADVPEYLLCVHYAYRGAADRTNGTKLFEDIRLCN
ncbi:MAG: hypothetical protein IPO56_11660 [Flavobacteriales bacterium]|nr:hypothetical protein [Flavobacteriales bacterium]